MRRLVLLSVLALSSQTLFAETVEQIELDCSKAVVGFLKEKGVITGGEDGLCISDLKSLPKIHVGLGSNTFPLGNADQFNVSKKTQDNLKTIQEVLTGKNSKAEVSFVGYADGEQNNIAPFDSRFLKEGETSYTKSDLKNKISDVRTLKTLLDLLKVYPEDAKIPYDQSKPELKTAQSLIRNYYLANDRAKKVCETAMAGSIDCSKAPTQGYASPDLETHGNKQCGPRRRAFMTVDLAPTGMRRAKSNVGKFSPQFEIPNPMEYQRDLQIASSLDLFAKLSKQTGGSDVSKYKESIDLILPAECQKNPGVLGYARDNSKRLIDDVNNALGKVSDTKFKSSVLKGDYKEIKKKLEAINEKEDLGKPFTAEEQAQQKVINIITAGSDKTAPRDYKLKKATSDNFNLGKELIKVTRTRPDGTVETLTAQYISKKRQDSSGVLLYTSSGERIVTSDYHGYYNYLNSWKGSDQSITSLVPKEKKVDVYHNDLEMADSKYPEAADSRTPSTDMMNCFSAAAAIEENIKENDHALTDASLLVTGDQSKLDLSLNNFQVAHLGGNKEAPRGWACTKCQSGVTLDKESGKFTYQARDYQNSTDASQSVYGQHNSNSLTVGSLKNLKVFNISRESFEGKCPDSKSVCDCVKEQGGLEKLLAHSSTEKISLLGEQAKETGTVSGEKYRRWDKSWTFAKPENHCVFTPPVPHTCQVDPKGRSQENKSNARSGIVACQILDNIKAKYNLAADIDVKKYKNVTLGSSLCRKSLPTTNEAEDCGFSKSSLGTSGKGSVSGQ